MRMGWNIKDNDESFFKHQIQFSALLGNIDDAAENFKELMNSKEDIEEIAELNIELKILFKAMKQLSNDELKLISLIYFEDKTERECAEIYDISQKNINKKKKRILCKLNKLIKNYKFQGYQAPCKYPCTSERGNKALLEGNLKIE